MCRQLQENPDCKTCTPEIEEENEDAWELWNAVSTQWRIGGMGALIGLDYTALFRVAEAMEIEMSALLLRKIKRLENWVIERQMDKGGDQ